MGLIELPLAKGFYLVEQLKVGFLLYSNFIDPIGLKVQDGQTLHL
jgi:hypothetical protein